MNPLGFNDFKTEYKLRYPAQVPKRGDDEIANVSRILWFFVFLSSAIISAVHTAPVVVKGISDEVLPFIQIFAGLSAVVMVEFTVFLSARHKSGSTVAKWALFIAASTAIVANIYSTLVAFQEGGSLDLFTGLVAILLGVSAPLIAITSGEMFTKLDEIDSEKRREADKIYNDKMLEFDKIVNEQYKKYLARMDKNAARLAPTKLGIFQNIPNDENIPHGIIQEYSATENIPDGILRNTTEYSDEAGIFQLLRNKSITQKEAARRLGKSQSYVSKKLKSM